MTLQSNPSAPRPCGGVVAGESALPYPSGWYYLARSAELPVSALMTRSLAGAEVVLYRASDGQVRAVAPYCPHLGAHFGAGGRVEGMDLVCPFHHFAYGPDGGCVRAPGSPPPRAAVAHHIVREINGMIFVWRGHDHSPPAWELPAEFASGPTPASWWERDLDTHPQEIHENGVDFRHLATLHRLVLPPYIEGPHADGPLLRVRQGLASERQRIASAIVPEQELLLAGLGVLRATLAAPRLGVVFHLWALTTPLAPWRTRLRVGTACTVTAARPARRTAARLLVPLLVRKMHKEFVNVIEQDVEIWNTKRYEPRPRLGPGDDAIGAYRLWARQFYPAP